MASSPDQIPTRVRLVGRAFSTAVARVPWLWPLLRAPMRRFFDRSAPGWDERTGAGSVDHLAGLAAAVTHVDPRPERILDIGTGTGEGALFLTREFPAASVRGIDLSERMIRLASAKVGLDPSGRVAFKVADASSLPYGDDSFDLVTQINVPPFFGEIARVLRPGGHVIVAASSGPDTPFFTAASVLERGLARHGIEIVESGSAGRGTWLVARAGRG